MHVAVIGAGASGLCAARHLLDTEFTFVVYEITSRVGGVWVYTEHTGTDECGLPIGSVMYKNLRTNLPTDNMEFEGFPYVNSKSFTTHSEVLQYLEDYADHFHLMEHIKFRHCVEQITPKNDKWQIKSKNVLDRTEVTEEFDAVLICNGHFSTPYWGELTGLSQFIGDVQHSHTYRTPEPFLNKTVLVVGGGPSGIDISCDLATTASKVYLSYRYKLPAGSFPKNIEDVPDIKVVQQDHVVFVDGTTSQPIDTILLCTGYNYSFPFLTPECGITVVDGKFVKPLYKDIINVDWPTMGFIGLPFHSFLFPLFEYQVRFFIQSLKGEIELPSTEDMLAEVNAEVKKKQMVGVPIKKYHELGSRMRAYLEDLANISQLEHLPPVVYDIYHKIAELRKTHLLSYREVVIRRLDDNSYEMTNLG